ncbi:MAG: winged helix-turn-helix transcriptional regulator [Rhodocyclaceae bacterium]|nr:winged helix-turn-helix transcriptional regulator [Rhodocyclaceae bacterium]
MKDGPHIARIATLIGDATRAEVLTALMADRALTATELAAVAGVTRATMSSHLARLVEAGLVGMCRQGRHRYFRLADPDVARLLESLMGVAFRTGAVRARSSPREPALRRARACYDHLAGELAVGLFDAMQAQAAIVVDGDEVQPGPAAADWFGRLGIEPGQLQGRRQRCRLCLDWSERRYHLGGALGAALFARLQAAGWLRRQADSRVVVATPPGERELARLMAGQGPSRPLDDHQGCG